MRRRFALAAAAFALAALPVAGHAAELTVTVHAIDASGVGKAIGTLRVLDTRAGLQVVPRLTGLSPGEHGFHVHTNGSCGNTAPDGKTGAGLSAGGHYDPENAGAHHGPHGHGHKGDLPALTVAADGTASTAVVAPRLKVADLRGRAIVIHAGGDNYSDQPQPLGGGGARVACAVVAAR